MKNTLLLLSIFAFCGITCSSYAAEYADSARIHFRQSKTELDTSYMGNGANLLRMSGRLRPKKSTDIPLRLSSIRVIGAASPEGSVAINRRLSEQRAERIFDFFSAYADVPDSIVSFDFIGRDWKGLLESVKTDSEVPYRDETASMLENIVAGLETGTEDSEVNLKRLKGLRGGVPYRYMYDRIFPSLRAARLYVEYEPAEPMTDTVPAPAMVTDSIVEPEEIPDTIIDIDLTEVPACEACRPFYMGVKTNLLYDALALPSIGAEFYVGKGWSVVGNWTYGWWDTDKRHRYWRAYGGDLAVRKWFGKRAKEKPLTGHHLGLYAGVVTYDFEFGGTGYMGGRPGHSLWDRCNFMGGIEYGYSLPIARRLNLDFTLGVGYMGGKVVKYVPKDGIYVWQSTKQLHWVGPTKLEVSLVWLIGCDNFNRKKGGEL